MTEVDAVLGNAATAIKSALGHAVHVVPTESCLALRFTRFESALVIVRVQDTARPSFHVTYPCLKPHHSSLSQAQDVDASGTLIEGVLGIARAVAEHGVVLPEFPDAHIRKQLGRRSHR